MEIKGEWERNIEENMMAESRRSWLQTWNRLPLAWQHWVINLVARCRWETTSVSLTPCAGRTPPSSITSHDLGAVTRFMLLLSCEGQVDFYGCFHTVNLDTLTMHGLFTDAQPRCVLKKYKLKTVWSSPQCLQVTNTAPQSCCGFITRGINFTFISPITVLYFLNSQLELLVTFQIILYKYMK